MQIYVLPATGAAACRASIWKPWGEIIPTLGVFAAITDEEGRILCVRMNYATRAWTTPGGRVELRLSPLDALKRELADRPESQVYTSYTQHQGRMAPFNKESPCNRYR